MARLASRFASMNVIRRERPLTNDELMHVVPSIFSGTNMIHVANATRTFQRLPFWKNCAKKVSSRSLLARHAPVMKENVLTPNI